MDVDVGVPERLGEVYEPDGRVRPRGVVVVSVARLDECLVELKWKSLHVVDLLTRIMTALAEYLQMTWLMSLYLVELLAELEGDDGVVPGVEDEDGEVDVVDEVVGAEGDVALVEGPREEPLEPRHLPPQVRHRVHADLQS